MRYYLKRLRDFTSLIRVHQWVKNGFVFLPMFFNGQALSVESLTGAMVAFISLSFTASSIYCINDIKDYQFDINHVEKKNRPYARGIFSKSFVIRSAIVLIVSGLLLALILNGLALVYMLLGYFTLNLGYTFFLKRIAYLDVLVIATSFVFRVLIGGVATETPLTAWIIVMVFLLALLLALGKRYDELLEYVSLGTVSRDSIKQYNIKTMNTVMLVLIFVICILYILYTLSDKIMVQFQNQYIYVTSIFVISGLVRYYYVIKRRKCFGNPTRIFLTDRFIQLMIVLWLITFYVLIY